jgi:DNA-directed RNA polymerase subunit beta'
MVIGVYYLSETVADALGAGRAFGDVAEATMAYDLGQLSLHAPINLRVGDLAGSPERHAAFKASLGHMITDEPIDGTKRYETTLGRALLNQAFPDGFPYINSVIAKSAG